MKKTLYLLLILTLSLSPSVGLASFDLSLKYGSRGDSVGELQDFLTDQGFYSGKIDGKFGLGTLKSVKAFQAANNLSVDGYFGKSSRAKADLLLNGSLKNLEVSEVTTNFAPLTAPIITNGIVPVETAPVVIEPTPPVTKPIQPEGKLILEAKPDSTVVVGSKNAKLASFVLTSDKTDDILVTTFGFVTSTNGVFNNGNIPYQIKICRLDVCTNQISTNFTINKGDTGERTVEIFGDLPDSIKAGSAISTKLTVAGAILRTGGTTVSVTQLANILVTNF